jgi:hypothetical protein
LFAIKGGPRAIAEVNSGVNEMRAEADPLGVHIFVSRRHYRKHCRH